MTVELWAGKARSVKVDFDKSMSAKEIGHYLFSLPPSTKIVAMDTDVFGEKRLWLEDETFPECKLEEIPVVEFLLTVNNHVMLRHGLKTLEYDELNNTWTETDYIAWEDTK